MSIRTLYVLVECRSRKESLACTDSHVEKISKSRYAGVRGEGEAFRNNAPAQGQVQTALHSFRTIRSGIP